MPAIIFVFVPSNRTSKHSITTLDFASDSSKNKVYISHHYSGTSMGRGYYMYYEVQ